VKGGAGGFGFGFGSLAILAAQAVSAQTAEVPAQPAPASGEASAKPPENDDGWPDVSGFLDQKYGFLPFAAPITEPAVGYGAAGGLMFISKPLGAAAAGFGRPNITMLGGFGTANGSWGVLAGDMRYWLDDRLQTLIGGVYASVNLDFHGIGKDSLLEDNPLRYNLEPKGGAARGKYRLGELPIWAGLSYAFVAVTVGFDAPEGTPGLPDYEETMRVAGLTGVLAFDNRDNFFTPLEGTFVEGSFGFFGKAFGGEHQFERASLTAIQYFKLPFDFYLGLRGDTSAAFGNAPFFLNPFISMRGVPMMRFQGEEIAQAELELRWQFYKRLSILAFFGGGGAWNDFERLDNSQGVIAGGGGFRYELARKYGIHMGVDVAASRETGAFYVQVGSAWMRP
jgi:hypothetical protein